MNRTDGLLPIMLCTGDRLAVVVGAGAVGQRKAERLAAAGMRVRLVDPAAQISAAAGPAQIVAEPYRRRHLTGATLAFACTDDPGVNAQVVADAREAGVLVCRTDAPAEGDFISPAVHRGDSVILAVATPDGSPAAAATLRDVLAAALPAGAEEFAAASAALRRRILDERPASPIREKLLRRLGSPDAMKAYAHGGAEALQALLEEPHEPDEPRMDGG
jgi:siroheme synthase-like protein